MAGIVRTSQQPNNALQLWLFPGKMKPSFFRHPIFSVDIHPDGTKFATGGQGTFVGISLWNQLDKNNYSSPSN
uniref:Uncharacterized protein n=1 Tax=Anolis carolinensis TaxID=28377 RepID=A0A803SKX2_ANOCA